MWRENQLNVNIPQTLTRAAVAGVVVVVVGEGGEMRGSIWKGSVIYFVSRGFLLKAKKRKRVRRNSSIVCQRRRC